jgi:aerobic-type carbon monoxide dehydrogenase small subunit (CoxS/CutS family)
MSRVTELHVNGVACAVDADGDDALLDVLRDDLGLTGCKYSCGEGACGACTVLVAGQVVRSCVTPSGSVAGLPIRTIEDLAQGEALHPLQQAFVECDALQCGYCTPGMIMAALALLERAPDPDEAAIIAAMQGNICRCGAYPRIMQAIRQAAGMLQQGQSKEGEQ